MTHAHTFWLSFITVKGLHNYPSNPNKKFAVVILSNCALGAEEAGNAIMKWLEVNE